MIFVKTKTEDNKWIPSAVFDNEADATCYEEGLQVAYSNVQSKQEELDIQISVADLYQALKEIPSWKEVKEFLKINQKQ